MKQKFTSEENKYLENKNLVNETKFNFKISCLMKKSLFKLMMTLAIVFGLSVSAMAQTQGTGVAPNQSYYALEGAVTVHEITLQGGDGNTTAWEVLMVSSALADVGETGAGATNGTHYVLEDGGTAGDASMTVRWLQPPTTGNLYAVQVTETGNNDNGNCTTIRRSYVSIFSVELNVFLTENNDGLNPDADNPKERCNNWSGTVIDTLEGTEITDMHADYINNPVNNTAKIDTTYMRIGIGIDGGLDLTAIKWRAFYSLQETANVNVYEIEAFDGTAFTAETGETTATTKITAGGPTGQLDLTTLANRSIYVPALASTVTQKDTANYDYQLVLHNLLGSAPTEYQVRLDSVQFEYSTGQGLGSYDNGTRYYSTLTPTDQYPKFSDGITGTQTINHGPATPNIGITD